MQPKIRGRDNLSSKQDLVAEHILRVVEEWVQNMQMERWELVITFVPTLKEGETEQDADRTWADTDTSWFYQTIHVTFYARVMDATKATMADIEQVVVHELGHSLVKPMESEGEMSAREHERVEFVVTNLARVLVGMKYRYNAG